MNFIIYYLIKSKKKALGAFRERIDTVVDKSAFLFMLQEDGDKSFDKISQPL